MIRAALLLPAVSCAALLQGTPTMAPVARIADTFLVDTDDGAPPVPATVAYAARLQLEGGAVDFWHVWVRGMRDTLLTSTPADLAPDEALGRAREQAWSLAREIIARTRCSCETLRLCPDRRRGLACT